MDYKKSGVDIDAGMDAVNRIKDVVKETFNERVLTGIGSFGAMFSIENMNYKSPVLISSSDGVGTKVKIAIMAKSHSSVGEDIVNHCIDDILTTGAKPLFFLDYIALNKMEPEVVEGIVKGMAKACKEGGCALIGGETAEMGDLYAKGEYDIAGFITGIVDKDKILDGQKIEEGDILIGLPSSGLHTNGYTLARKLFFDILNLSVDSYVEEIGMTVKEALLAIHINYGPYVYDLLDEGIINGIAHITGGGFKDNIPRVLKEDLGVEIDLSSWDVPPLFSFIKDKAQLSVDEAYRTFNMGIGLILFIKESNKQYVLDSLENKGIKSFIIGKVVKGNREVHYVG